MIAISVKQPWAYLLCAGIKVIENRTWQLPEKYKGKRVLIQASARPEEYYPFAVMTTEQEEDFWNKSTDIFGDKMGGQDIIKKMLRDIVPSAIIGSVVFSDCVVNHPSVWADKSHINCSHPLKCGSYGTDSCFEGCIHHNGFNKPIYNWVATEPVLFDKPIPAKGKLGFWNYEGIECQDIICPNCHQVEHAIVDHRTSPFSTFIHTCRQCGYIIMESEWDKVKLKTR